MYESWCRDIEEKNEFAKNYAILQGSFTNPQMAQKMIKNDNPDFEVSDEDFDRVSEQMLINNRKNIPPSKQKRKIINKGD